MSGLNFKIPAVLFVLLMINNYSGASKEENSQTNTGELQWTQAIISKPAPYWEGSAVVNGKIKEIKLCDYLGKYLVLFFYPLDFTFVCPTELLALNDRLEDFKQLKTEVVACSVDSAYSHLAWMNVPKREGGLGKLKYPILSDLTHNISRAYGAYLESFGHSLRAFFIIDMKGILRQITMNDLPVGRNIDEILRLIQAFQYTDQHEEVCPVDWRPGENTIIPDPVLKKDYFSGTYKTEL